MDPLVIGEKAFTFFKPKSKMEKSYITERELYIVFVHMGFYIHYINAYIYALYINPYIIYTYKKECIYLKMLKLNCGEKYNACPVCYITGVFVPSKIM